MNIAITPPAPTAAAAVTGPTPIPVGWTARLGAEALGTAVLVFAVAGAAVLSSRAPGSADAGALPVAVALGLSVLVSSYAIGRYSGGHFNPAVTIGLAVAGRFAWRDVLPYVMAQVVGGIVGASVVRLVLRGGAGLSAGTFASTGWGELSPGGFDLPSAMLVEIVATAILVTAVLGTTARSADPGHAGMAIGFTLTLIAIVAIPVSNGSFNPARSIATALYGGPEAQAQLWMSIVAPVAGAVLAGGVSALCGLRRRRARAGREALLGSSRVVLGSEVPA